MTMTLEPALERYRLVTVGHGCSDGGCLVQRPTGMHTNGGCKCPRDYIKSQRVMYAAQLMADAIDAHLTRPAQSVDVCAVLLKSLGGYLERNWPDNPINYDELADKLTAALQEKGNG